MILLYFFVPNIIYDEGMSGCGDPQLGIDRQLLVINIESNSLQSIPMTFHYNPKSNRKPTIILSNFSEHIETQKRLFEALDNY